MSTEEYRVAQLYMVAKFSREKSSEGEGIQVLKNEPYQDGNSSGQFTHKKIYLGSSLPSWVRSWIPESFCVEEKAWNAYPYVRNVYSCPAFGERFSIVTETRYLDNDDGQQENVHNLPPELLEQRVVDTINIAMDEIEAKYYKKEEDPRFFVSKKTNRGPLDNVNWTKTVTPRMCIYKIAKVEFRFWGAQTMAENWIHKSMVRDVVLLGHRQAFCWMDEWYGLTLEDIRKYEDETKIYLDNLRNGDKKHSVNNNNNNNNSNSNTTGK